MNKSIEHIVSVELQDMFDKLGMTYDEKNYLTESFDLFLKNGNNRLSFVVDFDKVWSMLGFTNKGNAKRILIKDFVENVDYITNVPNTSAEGGQNKMDIMLNVATFKDFCMKSNTPKAKSIRSYYVKVEELFHEAMVKIAYSANDQLEEMKETVRKDRHNILVTAHYKTGLVYIMIMRIGNIWIYKIGKTDNIQDRVNKLSSYFGTQVYVLDVFPCKDNANLERFIHASPLVAPYKYTEEINGHASIETYNFDTSMYERVRKYITNNRRSFDSKYSEDLKFSTINRVLDVYEDQPDVLLHVLDKINVLTFEHSVPTQEEINEQLPLPVIAVDDGVSRCNIYGPIVHVYDGNDTTQLLHVFEGITEATREIPNSSYTQIKFAVSHRLLYLGYRWFFTSRTHPNARIANDIGETVNTNNKKSGLIAMLTISKSEVEMIFQLQKQAAQYIHQMPSVICNAIKYNSPIGGHYFCLWDDLDDNLKNVYLENNELPYKKKNIRGQKVEQINPVTFEVVETHGSITEVVKKFKMSPKTVAEVSFEQRIHKGFIWRCI